MKKVLGTERVWLERSKRVREKSTCGIQTHNLLHSGQTHYHWARGRLQVVGDSAKMAANKWCSADKYVVVRGQSVHWYYSGIEGEIVSDYIIMTIRDLPA